jgi:hypothetical protein
MPLNSDHLTWDENWKYLLRCFPSIEKAPVPAKEQFVERLSKLNQRWVREAITLAVNKHGRRYLTLEHLLGFYKDVLPREPEVPNDRREAFLVDYWVFPARINENVARYKSVDDARAVAKTLPGSRVHARWARPGENGWYQDLDANETLATSDQETKVLCSLYALIAKSITNKDSTFTEIYARLSSPPQTPPLTGRLAQAERAEGLERTPSRVVPEEQGVCQPPLVGKNNVEGMILPKYELPPQLESTFLELKMAELKRNRNGDSDGAPPLEAGVAGAAPVGGAE